MLTRRSGFRALSAMAAGPWLYSALLLALSALALASAAEPSAYEELKSFGFPLGLLPQRVTNYTLDSKGKFALQLQSTCAAMLQGTYMVTYDGHISGTVSYGYIKHLKGVSVRAFMLDWTISGIRVRGNNLVFEVGITSAKFPLANFDDSPQCSDQAVAVQSS